MHPRDFCLTTAPLKSQLEIDNQIQRQKRFDAAKKIYNDLSYEHYTQYQNEKKKREERPSYMPQTKEELEARLKEIAYLKKSLQVHKKCMGDAHKRAQEEELLRIEEEKYRQMERQRIEEITKERYREALQELYHSENTPMNANMADAKRAANQREKNNRDKFLQRKTQPSQPHDEELLFANPAQCGITTKTIQSKWGNIPVNVNALAYSQQLKENEKNQKLFEQERQRKFKSRSKAAAYRAKCEKLCIDLQNDVNSIRKYEIDSHMTNEYLKKPASEIPLYQTYLIDERYQKRSEAVALFLSAPEAPKARKDAPSPLPLHGLPPSPNQSDDDDQEIDDQNFDFGNEILYNSFIE